MVDMRRTLIKYVIAAPKAKNPILAFQESSMRLRKGSATAVKIRRLSIPAQG